MLENIFLRDDIKNTLKNNASDIFDYLATAPGQVYRELEHRRTVKTLINGSSFFIKYHGAIGWLDFIKQILKGKLPETSGQNEAFALKHLQKINIPAPIIAGYGVRGNHPANTRSFVIMEEFLNAVSIPDLCKHYGISRLPFKAQLYLVNKTADTVRQLHAHGMNHRDCYLLHFMLDGTKSIEQLCAGDFKLAIFDLHRVQLRKHVPTRWKIKDLAALYFSSLDLPISERMRFRFMKRYTQQPLREELAKSIWSKVKKKGIQVYLRHQKQLRNGTAR